MLCGLPAPCPRASLDSPWHRAACTRSPTTFPLPPPQGQKRLVLSESCSRDSMSSQPNCTALNYSYGVNAWKSWVQAKYAGGETSKADELRFGRKCRGWGVKEG